MLTKQGNIIGNWLDYILIVLIALFGFLFLITSLSLSLLARNDQAVQTTDSLVLQQGLINQYKVMFLNGNKVDIEYLSDNLAYLRTYHQLPVLPKNNQVGN